MKTILVWITYILNLVVALPVIAIVFLMGCAVNSIFSAAVCLALFVFWGYYQYYNVVQKTPIPKGQKKMIVLILLAVILVCAIPVGILFGGFGSLSRDRTIHAADYQQAMSMSKSANWLMKQMIPEGATDIEFFQKPGFAPYAYLKCSCTPEQIKAFGLTNGYDFQGDNPFKNSDSDNPGDINGIDMALDYFHAEEKNKVHEIKNFLAYNCIHRNGGGFAFLYLVDKQLLYGTYAHH